MIGKILFISFCTLILSAILAFGIHEVDRNTGYKYDILDFINTILVCIFIVDGLVFLVSIIYLAMVTILC